MLRLLEDSGTFMFVKWPDSNKHYMAPKKCNNVDVKPL